MARRLPAEASRLLGRFSGDAFEVVCRLRSRVLDTAPRAHETVFDAGYTVSLLYGPDDRFRSVVYIAGFSDHANLGFSRGATLPDPAGVLVGTGRQMRHVKFFTPEETAAGWLPGYLESALAAAGLGTDMGDGRTTLGGRGSSKPASTPGRSRRG
jgi:hypothetical protein